MGNLPVTQSIRLTRRPGGYFNNGILGDVADPEVLAMMSRLSWKAAGPEFGTLELALDERHLHPQVTATL